MKIKDLLVEMPPGGKGIFGRGTPETNQEYVKQFEAWMDSMYEHAPNEVPWKWYQDFVEFTSARGFQRAVLNAPKQGDKWNPPEFLKPESWEYICADASAEIDGFVLDDLSDIPNVFLVDLGGKCELKSFAGIEKQNAIKELRLDVEMVIRNKLPILKLIKLASNMKQLKIKFYDGILSGKLTKLIQKHKDDFDMAEATEELHDMDLGALAKL